MDCPMDYSLCGSTVTRYRQEADTITRQVLSNCAYTWRMEELTGEYGPRRATRFTLILPGDAHDLRIGDRIYPGIGPEDPDWPTFIPAMVPGLGLVGWVKPVCWNGKCCHLEAGSV